jgi:hypothetical protein
VRSFVVLRAGGRSVSVRRLIRDLPVVRTVHSVARATLQEHRASASLRAYRREAARLGLVPPAGEALRAALRARLAARRAGRPPQPKGALHVFLAYYAGAWERILPRALAPFGEVTAFEWRSLGWDDRAPDWLARRDAMNAAMLEAFRRADSVRRVDAVVGYLSGRVIGPEVLAAMASAGAAVFNFCFDDKLSFPGPLLGGRYTSPAAIASVVDLNLTSSPDSVVKYAVHGGLATFFPEGAHPEVHRPVEAPFEHDVSFVGARYGRRPAFLRRLARRGVRVATFGRGWPGGELSSEEMVRLYSVSRVNLGFGGIGHSMRLVNLKGRDFEVPMSGGLYLTQDDPELRLVYDVGREVLTYRDADDCARIVQRVLADPGRAQAIRSAGRARCLRDHTYEARWTGVFQLAGLLS